MSKVIKKDGKYILEPDPVISARQQSKSDLEKLRKTLDDEELRALLKRLILRIEALEQKG